MSPLLGIDYGTSRIGLAVSSEDGELAFALGTHSHRRDGPFLTLLQRLIRERGITGLVIGLPLRTDGSEGDMARMARGFGGKLGAATGLPVSFVDERFSSREATGALAASGRRRRAKEDVDATAAQIILQLHLDRLRSGQLPGKRE